MYCDKRYERGFVLITGLVLLFAVSTICAALLLFSQKAAESKLFEAKAVKKLNTSLQLGAICEKKLLDMISSDMIYSSASLDTVTDVGMDLPKETWGETKAHIIYAGGKAPDKSIITEYDGIAIEDHDVVCEGGDTRTAKHFFVRTECADSKNPYFARVTVREYIALTDKNGGGSSLVPLYTVNKMLNKDK